MSQNFLKTLDLIFDSIYFLIGTKANKIFAFYKKKEEDRTPQVKVHETI